MGEPPMPLEALRKTSMSKYHPTSACNSFRAAAHSRRSLLRVGGLGLLGLTIPKILCAEEKPSWTSPDKALKAIAPRAKSVIFLYQFGGPSHIDMFDMKPDAPEGIRGPHKGISSSVPGLPV